MVKKYKLTKNDLKLFFNKLNIWFISFELHFSKNSIVGTD